MREIKFKVWDAENHEMFFPKKIEWNTQGELRFFNKYQMWQHNMVLMQYTGLHDKNGKEIYEGDMLKLVYSLDMGQWTKYGETTIQVKWSDFQCGFYPFVNFKDIEQTEVIGNIYENPELFEVKK